LIEVSIFHAVMSHKKTDKIEKRLESHYHQGAIMLRFLSIMVAVVLFSGVSLAQQEEQQQNRPYDADFSRPQKLGFGAALSLNRFAGDLQDGVNFPGATTDWGIGASAHMLWRFADAGDFATLHLLGRIAYSLPHYRCSFSRNTICVRMPMQASDILRSVPKGFR
jgi:hypothetical protein